MAKQEKAQQIDIKGDVVGQIAIGNHVVQIGEIHGAIVNIAAPAAVRARSSPVYILPRPISAFLDRESETKAIISALQTGQSVEIHGRDGVGKTALLRHIAHELKLPDGLVFLSAKGYSLDDLTQVIFDCFYECDILFKPTLNQIRHYLQNIKASILLDDIHLTLAEIEILMDMMPRSSLLLCSEQRLLGNEFFSIELEGLPLSAGISLVERRLGRQLTSNEYPLVTSICSILKGHPLTLIQVAVLVAERNHTFADIARLLAKDSSGKSLFADIIAQLTQSEKNVLSKLSNLGALTDSSIQELTTSTDSPDTRLELEKLKSLGLVQGDNIVYRSTDKTVQNLQREQVTTKPEDDVLSYYTDWSKRERSPEEIAIEATAILKSLELLHSSHRWEDVLTLTREVSDVFLRKKRFSILKQIMEIAHGAAQQTKNRIVQAWVLEKLYLCELDSGNSLLARSYLNQTLQLQEASGDKEGAARTRENLRNFRLLKIFLCHSSGDKPKVTELYDQLKKEGFDPWLDKKNLLPGQDWQEEIPKAVHTSDVVLVCLSRTSVDKVGFVQKEIRDALDKAQEFPEGTIYIVPLKLEECNVPSSLSKWQWVNLFEEGGYEKLIESLKLRAGKIGAG